MIFVDAFLVAVGLAGHVLFWVGAINRIHAWAVPRWLIDGVTMLSLVALAGIPLAIAADHWMHGVTAASLPISRFFLGCYLVLGVFVVAAYCYTRVAYRQRDRRGESLLANHTRVVDLAQQLETPPVRKGIPKLQSRLPGNELFDLHIHHKQVHVPRLPNDLAGLTIAHLSDFHMSGRLTRPFFEQIVKHTNDLHADMIAITGDLFDVQKCFEWIDATYAQLQAPHGVYFVLGNHDERVDTKLAVDLLQRAGLTYIGGRWQQLNIAGTPVVVAGNELPWFPPGADLSNCPFEVDGVRPLRILLSHSPDQFANAHADDVDLVLAGHNHGGQIRFPLIGALFAPSNHGTRYDMGTFRMGNTILHVSRGTGCLAPVRYNCPPEVALLELLPNSQPEA